VPVPRAGPPRVWPRFVPPARSAAASSMQSPPASAEATSVPSLSPVFARPGADPRSRYSSTSSFTPRCWVRVAELRWIRARPRSCGPGVGREGELRLARRRRLEAAASRGGSVPVAGCAPSASQTDRLAHPWFGCYCSRVDSSRVTRGIVSPSGSKTEASPSASGRLVKPNASSSGIIA
jgi:hypothetical protein